MATRLRYVDPRTPRGPLYRAYARFTGGRVGTWLSKTFGWKVDPILMRISGGKLGFGLVLPTALLETRGARTGRLRRNVVIYFNDGERVTLMPTKAGAPERPGWFHNLVAHPNVTLAGHPFRATVVTDDGETRRLWELADLVFPPYARYRKMIGRPIPLVQLVPAARPS